MINDFNSGTVGWTDWNILLDETGGPNHVQNLCFAPIHADTQNDSLIFTRRTITSGISHGLLNPAHCV